MTAGEQYEVIVVNLLMKMSRWVVMRIYQVQVVMRRKRKILRVRARVVC